MRHLQQRRQPPFGHIPSPTPTNMLAVGTEPDSSDCSFTTFFNTLSNNNNNMKSKSKSQSQSQRRFTDQQIKSLETIFQSESKLEPRKKLELAKDLGLQPRQVAIWFQNKRARWKSKQLERDYNKLRASYDSLSSRFDLLSRENQSLNLQLKKLHELIEKKGRSCSTDDENSNTNNTMEEKASLCLSSEKVSDADSSIKPEYEYPLPNMLVVEPGDRDSWGDLEPNPLLHDSTIGDPSNQWWDFWC